MANKLATIRVDSWIKILKDDILLQSPLHFFKADGLLITAFCNHSHVMKVLHQLLVPLERNDHTSFITICINDIMFLLGVRNHPLLFS